MDSTEYELKFHLYELIVPATCEVAVYHSDVKLGLRKVSAGCWPRLLKLKQTVSQYPIRLNQSSLYVYMKPALYFLVAILICVSY